MPGTGLLVAILSLNREIFKRGVAIELYSKAWIANSPEAHSKLLAQFADITEQHGLMLSERKMFIGKPGMKLFDGQYEAQPHIAQELQKFPEENLTKTQINPNRQLL